jgi:hypothetical protein
VLAAKRGSNDRMPRGCDAASAAGSLVGGSLAGEVRGMISCSSAEPVAGTSALVRHRSIGPTFQALTEM